MKLSKVFSAIGLVFAMTVGNSAQAAEEAFCTDGLRMVDLGQDGQLTARGFLMTLQTAKAEMNCRPETTFTGIGIWKNWFDSKAYTCRAKDMAVRAYLTRTGVLTTLQITNSFGFLIFNGACQVKRVTGL